MKKDFRQLLSLLLTFALVFSLALPAYAEEGSTGDTSDPQDGIQVTEPAEEGGTDDTSDPQDGIQATEPAGNTDLDESDDSGDESTGDGIMPLTADDEEGTEEGSGEDNNNASYVAQIGTTGYETLADAIAHAGDGDTVTLLANVELTEQLSITKNITIDLGTHTINDTASTWGLVVAGKVTIQNGTIKSASYAAVSTVSGSAVTTQKLVIDTSAASATSGVYMNGGTFTLSSNSTIQSGEAGIFILNEGTTANIYGTVEGVGDYPAIMGNGSEGLGGTIINIYKGAVVKAVNLAMYLPQSGTVNISGGTIEGYAGIGIKSGTLNITGGTIRGTANNSTLSNDDSSTNGIAYDGSAIVIDSYVGYAGEMNITISGDAVIESTYSTAIREIGNTADETNVVKLSIEGGTITGGTDMDAVSVRDETKENVTISGGTFSSDVSAYLGDGYTYNEDGTVTEKAESGTAVASVTDSSGNVTKFDTLAEAISALQAGGTLTLLDDITNDANNDVINIALPAGAVLEGGGHTLEGNINVTVNAGGGTIQNVKFNNIHNSRNSLSAVYASSLSGTLNVTGCSFHNCDWDALQITPVAGAAITITGNTFSTDNTDDIYQVRYVHIQSKANVDFSATVTQNVMYDTIKGVNGAGLKCGALEIYYFTDAEKIKVNENYIEHPDLNCILMNSGTNVGEMAYPLYEDDTLETLAPAPVAAIKTAYEGAYYTTLAEAIADAKSGGTITLLKDATESITIPADKNITLNLNGQTLTNEAGKDTITVALGGTLTVTGEGTVDNVSSSKAAVYNNGTCTLDGGNYTRTAGSWYTICNHGEMIINEGVTVTVDASVDGTSSMIENGYYAYSSTNPNERSNYVAGVNQARPSLTINGGTFTGGANTVKNDDGGILKITGGEFTCFTARQAAIYNCGVAEITGGTFTATTSTGYAIYNLYNSVAIGDEKVSTATTVSGGSFSGQINVASDTTLAISGGTFTAALKEAWCAEDYVPITTEVDGETRYTVEVGTDVVAVIHTDETGTETTTSYTSLARAVAAAENGDTIQLLTDVAVAAGDYVKISGKELTLDLAGHSITRNEGTTSGAYLIYLTSAGTELTVTDSVGNGSINGGDNPASEAIYVSKDSKATIQGGTVQGKTYGIYVYTNGTLDVQGGTVSGGMNNPTTATNGGIYIGSKNANVTISGGKVEGGSYGVYDLYGKLTVEDGAVISGETYGILAGYAPTSATSVSSVSSIVINGGSITGGTGGVCIGKVAASSNLTVTGGEISGTGETSYGIYAASAKAATIDITGGEISGVTYGVYEAATVAPTLTISEGEGTVPYIHTGEGGEALSSTNCTGFVSGGSFSNQVPAEYCAAGYTPTDADEEGLYTVEKFFLGVSTDDTAEVPATLYSGKDTGTIYVKVSADNVSSYSATAYPTTSLTFGEGENKNGYVFAGWYEDAEGTTPCTGIPTADAYAKFVDEDVLQAMWQMSADTTSESEKTNLRFVTTVDSLDYQQVGFVISISGGGNATVMTTTVYKQITGYTEAGSAFYSPKVFSDASNYFMTCTLNQVPNSAFNTTFTVVPRWITHDGTTVTGQTLNFTINNALSSQG